MTLASTPPLIDYLEDGASLTHLIPFQFTDASEIVCTRIPAGGVEGPPLAQGTFYSVAGGGGLGGSVTKTDGGTAGTTFRIRRVTQETQSTRFTNSGAFPAASVEKAFDRDLAIIQEVDTGRQLLEARALRVPSGETAAELPVPADRRGKLLGFNTASGLRELLSYSSLATILAPLLPSLVGSILKGDPGSAGEGYATRALLAARASPRLLDDVYLNEKGLEGKFVTDHAADWADQIAADERQGMFIVSTVDPTFVYRRVYDGPINVRWFGTVADNVTDDSAAILAAIAVANAFGVAGFGFAGGGQGVPTVRIPRGVYYMGTTTIDIIKTIILEGESVGESGGGATVLRWAAGATGIRVQMNNTTGATGTKTDPGYAGTASIIRNLNLVGGYTLLDGEFHGIHLRARASVRDCYIQKFEGDGIHIVATAGGGAPNEGNANGWEVTRCFVTQVRNGMFVDGADVNAGMASMVDAISCREWAINDQGFLGSLYAGCQASTCGSGAYRTTNLNAAHTFVGCYSESGQPTSQFGQLTRTIGGLHGAGVIGGVLETPSTNGRLVKWGELELKSDANTNPERGTALTLNSWGVTADINYWFQGTSYATIRGQNGDGLQFSVNAGLMSHFASGAGGFDANISATGIDLPNAGRVYKIQGFQVVGPRQPAIADDASGAANQATVNAILATMRTHGLIS